MRRCRFLIWVAATVFIARSIQPIPAREPQILSTGTASLASGIGNSLLPIISRDGRFVVFVSHANNLVANDDLRPYPDIFVRDRILVTTTLVSVNTAGTGGSDGDSGYPAISSNGRYVLFASDVSNLVANDTNGTSDVFLRDLQSGMTRLVSVRSDGQVPGTPPSTSAPFAGSSKPVMTPDARWIAFESTASDLVSEDTNGIADVFVRDMQVGATLLVSVGAQPFQFARGRSHSPTIAADGSRIAFVSSAANLVPGRTNGNGDIYVRDLPAAQTFWASSNLVGSFNLGPESYACTDPALSSDGRYVAFKASVPGPALFVFYHDLTSGATTLLATNSHPATAPAFSEDGRWLAFEENNNVYLRDTQNGTNTLVSVNHAGASPTNGVSVRPTVTPDGRYVAFVSSAPDLISNGPTDANIALIYIRDVVAGVTRLVSVATNGAPSSFTMEGVLPAVSADGQLVAFDSEANDLLPDDNNQAYDVFVRNLTSSQNELISVRHADRPARTGVQSAGLSPNSISADGRFVAFTSLDDPRVPFDTNRQRDVFTRDLVAGTATRQSTTNDIYPGSFGPILSANGQGLLFLRHRMFLYPSGGRLFWAMTAGGGEQEVDPFFSYDPTNRFPAAISPDGTIVVYPTFNQLYWKNMLTGETGRVSQMWTNVVPPGPSANPMFSHDGRLVAFASSAAYLVSNSPPYFGQHLYVRDMQASITRIVSVDTNGAPLPNPGSTAGIFSGNDRYVVFDGIFDTDQQRCIYRYDLQTGQSQLICSSCVNPVISDDGQVIAYGQIPGSIPAPTNIYVMDLATGRGRAITTDYLGNNIVGQTFGPPLLSPNGRYVVFDSKLPNLVSHDTNRTSDVFVHDRVQGTTTLISRSRFGPGAAAGISSKPAMSADGRTVVFQSFANDLVEGDYNERRDVFVVRLGTGDSDNDGMDDDWEVAYFGNLNRNGDQDFDDDGHNDLQEFLTGTDPTNTGSILRVLTVTPMSGGNTTIVWSAVPGRSYVVQFKDSLNTSNWNNASGVLTASLTSESFAHASGGPQRFYRVIAVQ